MFGIGMESENSRYRECRRDAVKMADTLGLGIVQHHIQSTIQFFLFFNFMHFFKFDFSLFDYSKNSTEYSRFFDLNPIFNVKYSTNLLLTNTGIFIATHDHIIKIIIIFNQFLTTSAGKEKSLLSIFACFPEFSILGYFYLGIFFDYLDA